MANEKNQNTVAKKSHSFMSALTTINGNFTTSKINQSQCCSENGFQFFDSIEFSERLIPFYALCSAFLVRFRGMAEFWHLLGGSIELLSTIGNSILIDNIM